MNATPGANGTKCIFKMTVRIFNNGVTKVEGIPGSFEGAMEVTKMVNAAIAERFIMAAKENQLNDKMEIDGGLVSTADGGKVKAWR